MHLIEHKFLAAESNDVGALRRVVADRGGGAGGTKYQRAAASTMSALPPPMYRAFMYVPSMLWGRSVRHRSGRGGSCGAHGH